MGIPLSENKTAVPTTTSTYLGIEFDTIKMIMRLPKLSDLKIKIENIIASNKSYSCFNAKSSR